MRENHCNRWRRKTIRRGKREMERGKQEGEDGELHDKSF